MSVRPTSPATLFGGTWIQIKDVFLLAAGSTYAAGTTGGVANHYHSTGDCTLNGNQIPSHYHMMPNNKLVVTTLNNVSVSQSPISSGYRRGDGFVDRTAAAGGGQAHNHGNTGSSNNMPPYLAVYVWRRTD